jgi:hypothetical protein
MKLSNAPHQTQKQAHVLRSIIWPSFLSHEDHVGKEKMKKKNGGMK